MSYLRYPSYKDSGVPWVGPLPEHWCTERLAWLFRRKKEVNRLDAQLLSVYRDYGVIPKDSRDDNFNKASEDLSTYQYVQVGNLVLNKMKTWQGSIAISEYDGIVSPAYFVAEPISHHALRYLHYLLRSNPYVANYHALSKGIRPNQWDLDYDQFKTIEALLPPLSEQHTIVAFLDRETAQINALIDRLERLVALLQEKWQALISHAVTKGVNPSVPSVETATEWFGAIPTHWRLVPFKHLVGFQEGPGIMAEDFRDTGVPLLRIGNVSHRYVELDGCNYLDPNAVKQRWSHFRVQAGDLLISASATTGTVCEATEIAAGAIPYTGIIRLWPIADQVDREFLRYLVVSDQYLTQINLLKAGATIQHYGPTHLKQVVVACPPLKEQREIGEYLCVEERKVEMAQEKVIQAIAFLKERRSALITAAVTGQIDVRGSSH